MSGNVDNTALKPDDVPISSWFTEVSCFIWFMVPVTLIINGVVKV